MLTLVAEFQARPGKEEELRAELMALIEPTHAEPGCVMYDLHISREKPGSFLFFEIWKSDEDLDKHAKMPYIEALFGKVGALTTAPPRIEKFDKIG
jgi:quinol monooxygenase YgiN